MPVTIVLENFPDDVYDLLATAAKAHHRSVSEEAIARLNATVPRRRRTVEETIESVAKLRERLPNGGISSEEIVRNIRQDRDSH